MLALKYATNLIVWHDYTNPNYGVKKAAPEIGGDYIQSLPCTCFAFLEIHKNSDIIIGN